MITIVQNHMEVPTEHGVEAGSIWVVPRTRVPSLVSLNIRCRNKIYNQKGPTSFRATHILVRRMITTMENLMKKHVEQHTENAMDAWRVSRASQLCKRSLKTLSPKV